MNSDLGSIVFAAIIGTLLVAGCTDGPVGSEPDDQTWTRDNGAIEGLRVFTGRDSFGVAFAARASGTWSMANSCFQLTGGGNATFLGRIEVEQTICPDGGDDGPGGTFTYTGSTGHVITGEYVGGQVLENGQEGHRLVLKDSITGQSLPATQIETERGKADLTGTLHPNGRFEYRVEGWLLHHLR